MSSGGEIVTDSYYTVSDGRALYVFTTTYVRADGSQVSAQQRLSAASWPDAVDDVAFTPGELRGARDGPRADLPRPRADAGTTDGLTGQARSLTIATRSATESTTRVGR